jgi:hypothetical protein
MSRAGIQVKLLLFIFAILFVVSACEEGEEPRGQIDPAETPQTEEVEGEG